MGVREGVANEVCGRFMGVTMGVAIFLDQSIGIDETNTFQLK